jgi:CTP:molybdopterin cytidylyltransferase MocA
MGRPKPLLPLGNRTVIGHCLDTIIAAGLRDIIVVVGPDGDEIAETLRGLPVAVVKNESRKSEMVASVRIGLRALGDHASGVLICLVDHPLVSVGTMKTVIQAHREAPDKIIIPAYNGRRGHPSLFPASILKEIFSDGTLRDIVRRDQGRVQVIEVPDEGVVLDMDTREDYEQVLKRAGVV